MPMLVLLKLAVWMEQLRGGSVVEPIPRSGGYGFSFSFFCGPRIAIIEIEPISITSNI